MRGPVERQSHFRGGDLDYTYHSYYAPGSWQIIEERNGSDMVIKQHVWNFTSGGYIDELVQTMINGDAINDPEFDPADPDHNAQRYFAMQDANFNVLGIVDDTGELVERYEYTPYGQRTVYVSAGANDPQCMSPTYLNHRVEIAGVEQPYGLNEVGFQGLQHDETINALNQRWRIWNIPLGRFIQPDPSGYPNGPNRYAGYHVLHGGVDPSGLGTCPKGLWLTVPRMAVALGGAVAFLSYESV